MLKKADLGFAGKWAGGAVKPDLGTSPPCGSFRPMQSDLVLTGAAETRYAQPGIAFEGETQVLRTPEMVTLDWRRTVIAPGLLPCLRTALAKRAGASTKVVSVGRIAFPQISRHTAAIRVFVDVLFAGHGRTELTLTSTAPLAADATVRDAEVRLAALLVARAKA